MIVQRCLKGVNGISDTEANEMMRAKGILCNWWRSVGSITPQWRRQKLTAQAVDLHVNNYGAVVNDTPFISLTSGTVSRDKYLRTNIVRPARVTAVEFATDGGLVDGYIFYCWVLVGLNPAPEVEGVAEEVRELNTYRSYSAYQTEGEVTAKVIVPANQIEGVEKVDSMGGRTMWSANPDFTPPSRVMNFRDLV